MIQSLPITLASLVAANPLFSKLSDPLRAAVCNAFDVPLCVQEHETVLSEGQDYDYFAIVASGRLMSLRSGSQDRFLESGSFFGLRNLFAEKAISPVSIVAGNQSCVIHILRQRGVNALLATVPGLSEALLTAVGAMLPESPRNLASLSLAPPMVAGGLVSAEKPFKLCVFDSKQYQTSVMREVNNSNYNYEIQFIEEKLSENSVHLAYGSDGVCLFVRDKVTESIAAKLKKNNVDLVLYRCAGYDSCDVNACEKVGLSVARVPGYSPNAIAEHACALVLALNRRIVQASQRIHSMNFTLDGLTGFTMLGKTVGIIGTGRIGACLIRIMLGFGCNVICFDKYESPMIKAMTGVRYVTLEELLENSDIISLHCLLDAGSFHMINASTIAKMKRGVMVINTARGPLIDTSALIDALRSGHVGSAGLDVVEGEAEYFYEDKSNTVVTDDNISRLLSITNNVIITSHQAYLTNEALSEISRTTFENISEYIQGKRMREITNHVFSN